MLRRKKTKVAALLLSLAMLILLFTDISPYDVGLYTNPSPPEVRELNMPCQHPSTAYLPNTAYSVNPAAKQTNHPPFGRAGGGYCRLTYSFFHANALHLILNIWCFLSCVFLADVSFGKLLAAYIIACTAPVFSPVPTIGFSGVCFALLGFIQWQSRSKLSYNISVLSCIALPLLLLPHSVNSLLHAYCYAVAIIIGLLSQLSQPSHNSHSPY